LKAFSKRQNDSGVLAKIDLGINFQSVRSRLGRLCRFFGGLSTRVNKPENDDPSIIEPVELASDAA
jgi:hypothetical protein